MARFVSPPRSQLGKLRQALTAGERLVFDFFDSYLPVEWEIYIQPHLNGLCPDFVLLNPNVGIAVYEVKDWDLDAMSYHVEKQRDGPPILKATKNGKKFQLKNENPIDKVQQYKREIYDLYCPRLKHRSGFAAITAGVIFPYAKDERIHSLFKESLRHWNIAAFFNSNPIVGANALQSGELKAVFPEGQRQYSELMTQDLYHDFKSWLIEPDFSAEQRRPLSLDNIQKSYVKSRTTSGYRRIKGPAGSGKSLVLAARAAELFGEGKSVLVITYNITLLNYLKDLAVRWPHANSQVRKGVTWLNFHHWCKRVCWQSGYNLEYKQLWSNNHGQNVLSIALPSLVEKIIETSPNLVASYDAILVDEGQDFMPNWWAVLRKVCEPQGEMLLVADATQDIYDTAKSWTDETMKGAGFSGKWAELEVSYRLPKLAMDKVCDFALHFMPPELLDLPKAAQLTLAIEPCILKWVQVDEINAVQTCCEELMNLSIASSHFNNELAIADSVFLCDCRKMGFEVIKMLGMKGIKVTHTYDLDDKISRRQKMHFYKGSEKIKATTVHSFKGWESRSLVIHITPNMDTKSLALLYTALTRLKRHVDGSCLTVVSSAKELLEYGMSWPDFCDLRYQPY